MALYQMFNGPAPTTSGQVAVTTGTSLKTMMQIQPSATNTLRIVEWGISFDGSAAATPIKVELFESDVAATVTAYVQADIIKYDASALANTGNQTTNIIQIGTANSGYTSTGEGSTTVSRMFDCQLIAPTNQYVKQFPLGREPVIAVSKFLRIRLLAGAAVNAICYVLVEA